MVQHSLGPSRHRTLLPEPLDPPSHHGVYAATRGPDPFKTSIEAKASTLQLPASRSSLDDAKLKAILAAFEQDDQLEVVDIRHESPHTGVYCDWPDGIDTRILQAFALRGIERPYRHQARAIAALQKGEDIVLATATASGKSLCYQVPLLQAALSDANARALCIFPTKALARDQANAFRELASEASGLSGLFGVGVYDGDASPDQRRAAQRRAHVVVTNPDMLHRSILPNHGAWADFFAGLRYVVIDELHIYRGVLGSHVANVLRRLWRICRHYGSAPQVVACSATIANPESHAKTLCSRSHMSCFQGQDAPRGPRTFVIVNPAVVDSLTGVRGDYLKATRKVASQLRAAQIQGLVFCRSRKGVELVTRYLREDSAGFLRDRIGVPTGRISSSAQARADSEIRGYRGGYLPERRREVERALRDGDAQFVASTNALELGVDIGGLDTVVMAGYAGSRAATWQRAGRAGRRGGHSLVVLVCSSSPRDQFVAARPEFLHGGPIEAARLDADNPEVFVPHLRCAAHELPLRGDERFPGVARADFEEAVEYLVDQGVLLREIDESGSPQYFALGDSFPAQKVDIRGPIEENFCVVQESNASGRVGEILAEVDFQDAPLYLHVGAIYPIEGQTYEVRRLDWDARKAFVHPVQTAYFTEAVSKLKVRLIETEPVVRIDQIVDAGLAWAHVIRQVPGFKKIRFGSHETLGFGPVELPDLELHTRAAFWELGDEVLRHGCSPKARAAFALTLCYAMHQVAAIVAMCDPADLGRAVAADRGGAWANVLGSVSAGAEAELVASGRSVLYLYDKSPGGIGLVNRVATMQGEFFERVADFLGACRCASGCPTCLGPEHSALEQPGELRTMTIEGVRAIAAGYRRRRESQRNWIPADEFPDASSSPGLDASDDSSGAMGSRATA